MEGLLILAKYGSGRPEKEKNQVSVQLFYSPPDHFSDLFGGLTIGFQGRKGS